ncbi:UNVERIFIED_CONTAM: Kinesin light chain 3 [Siphonaria sp. JEL0065]|nr:Kinesin light chain 3 [Siphonaria sp. JEL0065]
MMEGDRLTPNQAGLCTEHIVQWLNQELSLAQERGTSNEVHLLEMQHRMVADCKALGFSLRSISNGRLEWGNAGVRLEARNLVLSTGSPPKQPPITSSTQAIVVGAVVFLAVVGAATWFKKRMSLIPTSRPPISDPETAQTQSPRSAGVTALSSPSDGNEDIPYMAPPNRLSSFVSHSLSVVSKKASIRGLIPPNMLRSASQVSSQTPSRQPSLRKSVPAPINVITDKPQIDGIRFSYVLELIEDWGGRAALAGKTTTQVCEDHIIPMTSDTNTSVCEQFLLSRKPSIRTLEANWFVSHVWEYQFLDVIDILQRFFILKKIPFDEAILWFDLFSVPQHESDERKFDWWKNSVMVAIKQSKNFVLVLQDWSNPVPLTRSWCSLELFCAASTRCSFNIATTEADENVLASQLLQDPSVVHNWFSGFKSELGVATNLRDQQMIHRVLRHFMESARLNELVISLLRSYLVEYVDGRIAGTPFLVNNEALVELSRWYEAKSRLFELRDMTSRAKEALSESLSLRNDFLGTEHPDTLRTKSHFAYLSSQLGENDFALITLQYTLESQRSVLGPSHLETLETTSRLAHVYGQLHRFDEAETLYKECIALGAGSIGKQTPLVISAIQDLACLLLSNSRLEEALSLYSDAYTTAHDSYGSDDKITLFSGLGLAEVQLKLRNYPEALRLYYDVSDPLLDLFGENSIQYWKTRTGLAWIFKETNRLNEAVDVLSELLLTQQRILGPNHPLTLETSISLALVYVDQENPKAESLLVACLARQRSMLGNEHLSTIATINHLAVFYMKEGRLEEAKTLFEECWHGQVHTLGSGHSETLATQLSVANLYSDLGDSRNARRVMSNYLSRKKEQHIA